MQDMLVSAGFWDDIEQDVSSMVGISRNADEIPRELLVSYLRDLEIMARTACARRQTIQIIASGRSLLGDRTLVGPRDGPFSHT